MDRPTTRIEGDARTSRIARREALVLPSRRRALETCRKSLGLGPVLLTGEAGSGKTWLWRQLASESVLPRRWLGVDLTPADGPNVFYRLVGQELGLVEPDGTASRVGLIDFLAERQAEGERSSLVVEEAHNLSTAVWEEIRVLANRLGEPGGFASLVLVGQTALARKFATRPFAGIEARLAAQAHLGPIDADEAFELLTRFRPGRDWSIDEVEALHRDSSGNPGRLLRKADLARVVQPPAAPERREAPAPTVSAPLPASSLLGQSRPPLILEDHLIEVGWSPDDEPSFEEETEEDPAAGSSGGEEANDHHAALRAWQGWSEDQARLALAPLDPGNPPGLEEREAPSEGRSPLADRTTIWADGEQPFAPFGQLFSRLAQARDSD